MFRYLWIATVVSNIGSWMYNAAAGWLMTSLDASPLIVSLVQVTNSLPLFLFALPAGALADIVDRRRFIVMLEILTTVISAVFATLVLLHMVTPSVLLLFLFLVGVLTALESPAWQAIVPQLVPRDMLSSAVASNSLGINISRAVGPALAGIAILGLGIAAPFWIDAVSNAGVIAVLLWWRAPPTRITGLPAERLTGAIRIGVRYARHNHHLRVTLARAVGFFLFASAYWALLPLVSRAQLRGGPTLYGVLLGSIGVGAIAGAMLLPRLKSKYGANGLVNLGTVGTAGALVLFGVAHAPWTGVLACLLAGLAWILALASLNVSAQTSLPDWVRGRGLAAYVTVFFGSMALGSALWGFVAQQAGLPTAHFAAAAGALAVAALMHKRKLHSGPAADLTPSMHWPEPVVAIEVEADSGPVLVTVEYLVDPPHREPLLKALKSLARERRRDGAFRWGLFQDAAKPERLLETFLVDSWLEHLRQHHRVTHADRLIQEQIRGLLRAPPTVTHFVHTGTG